MCQAEADMAITRLQHEGVEFHQIRTRTTNAAAVSAGAAVRDVALIVDVKGARGGHDRREYTSYAAFERALPSLKRRNSTRRRR